MSVESRLLKPFILRIFLWLPPCFALWYFTAPYHAALAAWLARLMINIVAPGTVSALELSGADVTFVTTLTVQPAPGQTALLLPEVNALLYSYGLALFLALMLAERATWWKMALGISMLLPIHGLGIAFDVLAQIGIRLGPEVARQAGLSGWRLDVIALGYQFGILILPTLLPIVLWSACGRMFNEIAFRLRAGSDGRGWTSTA